MANQVSINHWIHEKRIIRRAAVKKDKNVVLDQDLAKAGAALRRAAKQAKKIAIQTNTPLVIYEKGRVIKKMVHKEEKP